MMKMYYFFSAIVQSFLNYFNYHCNGLNIFVHPGESFLL